MDIQHEPIQDQLHLSPTKEAWLKTQIRPSLTRCAAIANVVTTTHRKHTNQNQTIWDSAFLNAKLHDGEPQLIVEELERRWPNFFEGLPIRNDLTFDKKKEFVGEWCKIYIKQGKTQYGKPALRKTLVESNESDLIIVQ